MEPAEIVMDYAWMAKRITALEERNKRLVEALEWIAKGPEKEISPERTARERPVRAYYEKVAKTALAEEE